MSKLLAYERRPRTLETPRGDTTFAYRGLNMRTEGDRQAVDSLVSVSRYSSRNGWKHYDGIGEVHYGISRSARIAGYANLKPERVNAIGRVEEERELGVLADIVSSIYSPFGGVRALVERFYTLMKISAEGYLIRIVEDGVQDGYWILSPDEIDSSSFTTNGRVNTENPIKWITAATSGISGDQTLFTREIQPEDFMGRIWNPSKRWTEMVDSPMTALDGVCTMLTDLTSTIHERIKSRFAMNGVFLIPNTMNDANIAGPKPTEQYSNKIITYLITLWTRNVYHHGNADASIPAILMGPPQDLEFVRHMIMETAIDERDMEIRAELIDRILDGLDVQKRKAKGGEGANHWDSWSDSEDEIRLAVKPDMQALSHVLTRAILRKELTARGWTPGRIAPWRVGFDLSDAVTRTNQGEDFRQAFDRTWITAEAGRRSIGAHESDAPKGEEYVRSVGLKLADPYLSLYGIDGTGSIKIDWDKVKTTKPTGPAAGPGQPGRAGPGTGSPGSPGSAERDTPKARTPQ